MARKKESIYKNWDEVNTAMKELGELYIEKQDIEGKLTARINEVKAYCNEKAKPTLEKIKTIEKEIERFSNQNKDEFLATRTKKLHYGTISYRVTKKVQCRNVESTIKVLKSLNLDAFIRTKSELNKDEILACSQDKSCVATFAKADINILTEDKIKIEPDYVQLALLNKNEEE